MSNRRESVIRVLAVAVTLAIVLGFTGIQIRPLGVEIAPQWEQAVAAAAAMPGDARSWSGATWLALATDEQVCIYTNTFGPDGRWNCRNLTVGTRTHGLYRVEGLPTAVCFLLAEPGSTTSPTGDVWVYNLITDTWEDHLE
jgi:hypothetical protein